MSIKNEYAKELREIAPPREPHKAKKPKPIIDGATAKAIAAVKPSMAKPLSENTKFLTGDARTRGAMIHARRAQRAAYMQAIYNPED